ncbi:hypothetical protein PIB30_076197 [Stylosanthes scabra]|uniref:Uncharacterized protein n=1 Tax=Stylosanthes scabra TaxID=79078 RepID=A0ABU6URY3_9FABA|nr:hypothetical protein [Stylosanthes scabra]
MLDYSLLCKEPHSALLYFISVSHDSCDVARSKAMMTNVFVDRGRCNAIFLIGVETGGVAYSGFNRGGRCDTGAAAVRRV